MEVEVEVRILSWKRLLKYVTCKYSLCFPYYAGRDNRSSNAPFLLFAVAASSDLDPVRIW